MTNSNLACKLMGGKRKKNQHNKTDFFGAPKLNNIRNKCEISFGDDVIEKRERERAKVRARARKWCLGKERLTFTRKQSFANGKINLGNQIILSNLQQAEHKNKNEHTHKL